MSLRGRLRAGPGFVRRLAGAVGERTTRRAAAGAAAAGAAIVAGRAIASARHRAQPGGDSADSAFRIKRRESAPDAVQRIALGRADSALEGLGRLGEDGTETEAAVHEARKDLKKLRSTLRLIRPELGKLNFRRENARFRDAGRELAAARDAEAKLGTVEALAGRYPGELSRERLEPVRAVLGSERDALVIELRGGTGEAAILDAEARIEAGRAAIAGWSLESRGWDLIGPGLRRSYKRGRDALAAVREQPSAESLHEWRKRVKDLWYHLRLLRNSWPLVVGATRDAADELADLLGDHHDLVVLDADLRGRGLLGEAGEDELADAIERRQGELLAAALELGERLYAEKPKAFTRRMRVYWRVWR